MKRVAFYTNLPSPYRVDFFNELGKNCELFVFFEMSRASNRDEKWFSDHCKNFTPIFLNPVFHSAENAFCPDAIVQYKKVSPEINVVCSALSPTGIRLIDYFIRHNIEYSIEGDGAFDRPCSWLKGKIKQRLFGHAKSLLYTSEEHKKYLLRFGAREEQLFKYPFSSVCDADIELDETDPLKKEKIRKSLGIDSDRFLFLSAGRYLGLKNFESVIDAYGTAKIPNSELIIVGGEPTKEYLNLIQEKKIKGVRFVPFVPKQEFYDYLKAADCFVFASLGDIWGLVINEALANGVPVISSKTTLSAVELVANGADISLFDGLDVRTLADFMIRYSRMDSTRLEKMRDQNLRVIKGFTIEAMANRHLEWLDTTYFSSTKSRQK